jgi:hypothetical protein
VILLPLHFNLAVVVLTRMLYKTACNNLISGLYTNLYPGGVIFLQYADDTILVVENNVEKATNLKSLTCFEKVSGMKINYSE